MALPRSTPNISRETENEMFMRGRGFLRLTRCGSFTPYWIRPTSLSIGSHGTRPAAGLTVHRAIPRFLASTDARRMLFP
jgi:hypothetical protein